MLLGLTGRIGTGKSEVARILKQFGALVISADAIGKAVVDNKPAVLKKLVRGFGEGIIDKKGKLNRRKLGRLALANEESRRRLNEIVHPFLLRELDHQAKISLKRNRIVVVDAALLIDWGWQKKVDKVILVQAPDRICLERLLKKGYSVAEARARLGSQLPDSVLKEHADIIISNSKSLDVLQVKVKRAMQRLL
ncbi:MAG: dephospho-CoA kinase [Candidatus Zixiibacteriota bacterium]